RSEARAEDQRNQDWPGSRRRSLRTWRSSRWRRRSMRRARAPVSSSASAGLFTQGGLASSASTARGEEVEAAAPPPPAQPSCRSLLRWWLTLDWATPTMETSSETFSGAAATSRRIRSRVGSPSARNDWDSVSISRHVHMSMPGLDQLEQPSLFQRVEHVEG